jgi:hypothetical protein
LSARKATTEESVEYVSEITESGSAEGILATIVILSTSIAVAQHFIGVRDCLETLLSLWCWVYIGMKLARQFAISLLNLVFASIARNT